MSEIVKVRKMIGIAFGVIFLLVGIGIVGYYMKAELSKEKPDGFNEHTKAEVIGYEYSKEGQAAVVVEYVVNNEIYTLTSNCYSSAPERIGKQLKVQYDSRYPRKAVLITTNNDIMVLVVGGLFVVVSIFITWGAAKEEEGEEDFLIRGRNMC